MTPVEYLLLGIVVAAVPLWWALRVYLGRPRDDDMKRWEDEL